MGVCVCVCARVCMCLSGSGFGRMYVLLIYHGHEVVNARNLLLGARHGVRFPRFVKLLDTVETARRHRKPASNKDWAY